MDTIIDASAHNVDGMLACLFVLAAIVALWVIEHKSAAEHAQEQYRRHYRRH